MPRPCTTCKHPNRSAIEAQLNNGTPFRNLAQQFQVSASSLFRHKEHIAEFPIAPNIESDASPTVPSCSPENEPETENGQRLTIKQRLFIEHYLTTRNGTLAARLAGYSGDNHQLSVTASRTLGIAGVRAEIDNRLRPFILSANEVMDLLSQQANGNMEGLLTDGGRLDLEKARENGSIKLIKKMHFDKQTGNITTVELHDAQAAAVHIGRRHKLFTDKVETDSPQTREQLDKLTAMVEELVDKYSITPAQAREIVDDVYGDSDLATNSVS